MNASEDETSVSRPNDMLPAVLLTGLGYYIAFNIAEQPDTPNALLLKIIGLGTMTFFGFKFLVGLKRLLTPHPKANAYKEKNY